MGDYRNKIRRKLDDERIERQHRETQARDRAKPKPRCRCGLTFFEVPIMWQIGISERPIQYGLFCPACLPAKYLPLIAGEVANLPDDEGFCWPQA